MFISELGNIYEFGFKIGFLKNTDEEEFQYLINPSPERLKVYKERLGIIGQLIEDLQDKSVLYTLRIATKKQKKAERDKPFRNFIPNDKVSLIQGGIYQIGLYNGTLFAEKFKDIKVIRCDMFNEIANTGHWANADLIFRTDNVLHVYDLKLFGGFTHLDKLLTPARENKEPIYLPFTTTGIRLSIAIGNDSLDLFCEALLDTVEPLLEQNRLTDYELKALIQVMSYLTGYLTEEIKFERVRFGIITPTTDSLFFNLKNDLTEDKASYYREKFMKLYHELKQLQEGYNLEKHQNLSIKHHVILLKRVQEMIEGLEKEIQTIKDEISKRNNNQYTLDHWISISELRKVVKSQVKEFIKDPYGKVLVLLHSTGAGKTVSTMDTLLGELAKKEKLFVFYFAPKLKLLDQQISQTVEKYKDYVEVFYDKSEKADEEGIYLKKTGIDTVMQVNKYGLKGIGKLKKTVSEAITYIINPKNNKTVVNFLTTQSITKTNHNGNTSNTLNHLIGNLNLIISKGYKVFFIIDELTGSDNGFQSMKEIISVMRKIERLKDKVSLLVFDATLHSKGVFEKVWQEFNENGFLPPSLVISDFERDGKLEIDGIEVIVKSDYSFPAKSLSVKEVFFITSEEEELLNGFIELAVKELKKANEEKGQLFIYVQNREYVYRISSAIKNMGYKTAIFTSEFKEEVKDDTQVIIATSSMSRGVSLPRVSRTIVFNTHFASVEENLAEELQAIARMRGRQDDHLIGKSIIKAYGIAYKIKDKNLEKIQGQLAETKMDLMLEIDNLPLEYGEEIKKKVITLEELIQEYERLKGMITYSDIFNSVLKSYFSPQKKVIVVVPKQMDKVFRPEDLSKVESFLSYLSDLAIIEGETANEYVKGLIEKIRSLLVVSISPENARDYEFFPPYLFYENAKLRVSILEAKELRKAISAFKNLMSLKKEEKELKKITEFENLIDQYITGSGGSFDVSVVIYLPSLVLSLELLDEDFLSRSFILKNYITRANIKVLGGGIRQETRLKLNEYSIGVRTINFPVESSERVKWLEGTVPRVSGDLLNNLFKSIIGG